MNWTNRYVDISFKNYKLVFCTLIYKKITWLYFENIVLVVFT